MARGEVRYAVVGLGHIAQVAVLPAFQHAENSRLVALVSGDREKLRELGERYGVAHQVSYDRYESLLQSGEVDAVYLALPNHLHRDYAVAAAEAGVHVLCEKPMAVTEAQCRDMMEAAERNDVRLMVAYRLHFEAANMAAVGLATNGRIGDPRVFTSTFTQRVKKGDVRLMPTEEGGGPVYDMGVYCLNAARYLFRYEPLEVAAMSGSRHDPRFHGTDESMDVLLRFPGDRLAAFAVGFGAWRVSDYRLVGTRGQVRLDPAYSYQSEIRLELESEDGNESRTFPKRDQFGPEILYFSDCIQEGRPPEPDGLEGLADIRLVEAIYRSAREERAVRVDPVRPQKRPVPGQEIGRPGIPKPDEFHASGPGK